MPIRSSRQTLNVLPMYSPATIWPGDHAAELTTLYADMSTKALTTDAVVAQTLQEYQDQMNQYIQQ